MKKLDESKVGWIISQKQKGETTSSIAETMNVSTRWVKKLWARYRYADAGKIVYPVPMGRPKNGLLNAGNTRQCLRPEQGIIWAPYACTGS